MLIHLLISINKNQLGIIYGNEVSFVWLVRKTGYSKETETTRIIK